MRLLCALVAPEEDVKAGAKAVSLIAADVGKPEGSGMEVCGVPALGHERNPGRVQGKFILESVNFVEIGF